MKFQRIHHTHDIILGSSYNLIPDPDFFMAIDPGQGRDFNAISVMKYDGEDYELMLSEVSIDTQKDFRNKVNIISNHYRAKIIEPSDRISDERIYNY